MLPVCSTEPHCGLEDNIFYSIWPVTNLSSCPHLVLHKFFTDSFRFNVQSVAAIELLEAIGQTFCSTTMFYSYLMACISQNWTQTSSCRRLQSIKLSSVLSRAVGAPLRLCLASYQIFHSFQILLGCCQAAASWLLRSSPMMSRRSALYALQYFLLYGLKTR